jgi:hypothetical protein
VETGYINGQCGAAFKQRFDSVFEQVDRCLWQLGVVDFLLVVIIHHGR